MCAALSLRFLTSSPSPPLPLPACTGGQEPAGSFQDDPSCIQVHQSSKVQCQQHKKQEKDNTVVYSETSRHQATQELF
jgi:hypothetical protein